MTAIAQYGTRAVAYNRLGEFVIIMRNILCFAVCLAAGSPLAAHAQPPGQPAVPAQIATPADVQPGSINNEDVPFGIWNSCLAGRASIRW